MHLVSGASTVATPYAKLKVFASFLVRFKTPLIAVRLVMRRRDFIALILGAAIVYWQGVLRWAGMGFRPRRHSLTIPRFSNEGPLLPKTTARPRVALAETAGAVMRFVLRVI
jgi:hypothetical protein